MTPSLPTSRKAAESQVPDEFICPLTLSIMVDPVMDAYGHNNFEKSAIMAWIYEGNTTCPLTRRTLKPRYLANNTNLKDDIEDWKRENNISGDCCSVPNEKGDGDQVVFGILDFGKNQRKGKRSSKASKQSSKANHRLDIVARLLQQLEITTSGSKQTEETEALAENFLRSLNDEQLEALNMICDINSGHDTALLAERYIS
jgi:hypothetical protein